MHRNPSKEPVDRETRIAWGVIHPSDQANGKLKLIWYYLERLDKVISALKCVSRSKGLVCFFHRKKYSEARLIRTPKGHAKEPVKTKTYNLKVTDRRFVMS